MNQLKQLFPDNWQILLNNCKAIQALGFTSKLARDEAVIAQKPNDLQDDTFSGKFNNPSFRSAIDAKDFIPIHHQRMYVRPKEKTNSKTPNINLRSLKKTNEKLKVFLKPWQEYSDNKNEE